jgi:hypothetical protein
MLLVQITINAVDNYVSVEGHALTHNWRPFIIGFDAPTLSLPTDHGGYAQMTYGSIEFNPALFAGDWPPPVSCPITIYYTDSTEAAQETVFAGTAHLKSFNREQISYTLRSANFDEALTAVSSGTLVSGRGYKILSYVSDDDFTNLSAGSNATGVVFTASGTTPTHWAHGSVLVPYWNTNLNAVITNILGYIPEINTVNTTYARASSPNVTHNITGDTLAIQLASDIAAFYSHLIYVVGDTAYLVDMLRDNGSRTLTEYQFFASPTYEYKVPVASVGCTVGSASYSKASSYAYGTAMKIDPYHVAKANIETALTNILTCENAPRAQVKVPMIAGNFPAPGEKVTFPDTGNVADLSTYIRVRKMQFDFVNSMITLEGEGAITA